jgi:hypothetical protein
MELLGTMNRMLDGMSSFLGAPSQVAEDGRVSLDRLRCKQGQGLEAVAVSMAMIARPIMRDTLVRVREAKKNQKAARSERAGAADTCGAR